MIFGHFGFPQMGIVGAAIATLIARVVECMIIVVYVFRIDKKIGFQVQDIFQKIDRKFLNLYALWRAGTVQRNALVDWQYDAVGYHGT